MHPPLVSIIMVTWNSGKHLSKCFLSLSMQTLKSFEVVVIDNGSVDNSLDELSNYLSQPMTIKSFSNNLGFAIANNIGVHLAQGEWVVLLNADAYPEPDWLENLVKASEQNPQYNFLSSRQLQYDAPHLLDGAGDEYHVSGLAWRRYYNSKANDHGLQQEEVFGACGAAAMYRREDFINVGGFDEDFFSYFEDVDLSLRLRMAGGRCLYVPQAVVYHVGSASTGKLSDFVVYHGHRNLVWTYFKDMPLGLLWFYLPLHILMNIFFIISFTFQGKGRAIIKAKYDAFRKLSVFLKKRSEVQKLKRVPNREIVRFMSKGLLEPYLASRLRNMNGKKQ